jgi:hypothetical protein
VSAIRSGFAPMCSPFAAQALRSLSRAVRLHSPLGHANLTFPVRGPRADYSKSFAFSESS